MWKKENHGQIFGGTSMKEVGESVTNLSWDNWCPSQESKQAYHKYKTHYFSQLAQYLHFISGLGHSHRHIKNAWADIKFCD
jgi:hypothetical protein